MHINTNPNYELPDNHPYGRHLNDEERALYSSVTEAMIDGTVEILDYQKRHGNIDPDDPELSDARELTQNSAILCEMIEELAVWRLSEADWEEKKQLHCKSKASDSNADVEGNK
jgi:hypothetical protein